MIRSANIITVTLFVFLFDAVGAFAQDGFPKIKPIAALQLWSTYTDHQYVYHEEGGTYLPVENRLDFVLRRSRVGLKADLRPGLHLRVVGAFDQVGRDLLSGTVGGSNNGGFPGFGLWDARVEWRLKPDSEMFWLYAGYFVPAVSRESVVSAFDVPSMEKSFSQGYIRQHLAGRGPGRTMGVMLGGLVNPISGMGTLKYAVGIHNPLFNDTGGNTSGTDGGGPMICGRLALLTGAATGNSFSLNDPVNNFLDESSLTIGISGSWQSGSVNFEKSWSAGMDGRWQWHYLSLDGEWYRLGRLGHEATTDFSAISSTGFLRAAWTSPLGEKNFLEPSVMWMFFRGATDASGQAHADMVGSSSGEEDTYDAGLNLYLNKRKLKVYLHYTWRRGLAGSVTDSPEVNMYYFQSGVGPIRRGNWIGLGLNVIL